MIQIAIWLISVRQTAASVIWSARSFSDYLISVLISEIFWNFKMEYFCFQHVLPMEERYRCLTYCESIGKQRFLRLKAYLNKLKLYVRHEERKLNSRMRNNAVKMSWRKHSKIWLRNLKIWVKSRVTWKRKFSLQKMNYFGKTFTGNMWRKT